MLAFAKTSVRLQPDGECACRRSAAGETLRHGRHTGRSRSGRGDGRGAVRRQPRGTALAVQGQRDGQGAVRRQPAERRLWPCESGWQPRARR